MARGLSTPAETGSNGRRGTLSDSSNEILLLGSTSHAGTSLRPGMRIPPGTPLSPPVSGSRSPPGTPRPSQRLRPGSRSPPHTAQVHVNWAGSIRRRGTQRHLRYGHDTANQETNYCRNRNLSRSTYGRCRHWCQMIFREEVHHSNLERSSSMILYILGQCRSLLVRQSMENCGKVDFER